MQADFLLRIELLGGVTLRVADRVIERFTTVKTASLLAWLACHRRPTSREVLADLLWPEAEREAGRNRLRVALASLRRQVEPPGVAGGSVLIADRTQVQLNPLAFTTDVAEFEAALEEARRAAEAPEEHIRLLQAATDLYQGEFLAGFYDEWMLPERTRLAGACLGALRHLARALARQKSYEAAIDCACRAVAMDPYGESSHRTLMRLYAKVGRPSTAVRQFEELSTLLHEELGTGPSLATRELLDRIRLESPRDQDEDSPRLVRAGESRKPTTAGPEAKVHENPVGISRNPLGRSSPSPPRAHVAPKPQGAPLPQALIPVQFTRFFGREELLGEVAAVLGQPRVRPLVTLTGAAGVGKTRLAVEIASRLGAAFGHRVWFVSVGDLGAGGNLMEALAAAMRLGGATGTIPEDQVVDYLCGAPALLVLDDLHASEPPGAGLAQHLDSLRKRVPDLACLATARRRLDLDGEIERTVYPLPLPPHARESLAEVMGYPSIALFVDRAQAARPDFQVTPGNVTAVVGIVAGLEGLPLALELAAAWAQVLTPSQMLERLSDRFNLLVSRRRTRECRHRSLHAAIESSYDLLPAELQVFFGKTSIFRGGWSLDATERVLGEPAYLELLDCLRQYSLVRPEESPYGMRFRQLDSLREFADERLGAAEREELRAAHARYYMELAEHMASALAGVHAEDWLHRLELDHDNLSAALEWGLEGGQPQQVLRAASAVWPLWQCGGHLAEGVQWLRRALQATETAGLATPPQDQVAALAALGRLEGCLGRHLESCRHLEQCMALARDHGISDSLQATSCPPPVRAAAIALCLGATEAGDYETAWRANTERVSMIRRRDDPWDLARALSDLARVAQATGRVDDALGALHETLALRRSLGDQWGCADTLLVRAEFQDDMARQCHAEGTAIFATLDPAHGIGATCLNVGSLAAEQGELSVARALFDEALEAFTELNDPWGRALCLERLGLVACWQDETDEARSLLGEALASRRELRDGSGTARVEQFVRHLTGG